MANSDFNFAEMVCFSLYTTANAMVRDYRPALDKLELTYPQFIVMMSLWNQDCVLIKELSSQTRLDASTLTQVLKRLETKGFVRRVKSPEDERAKVISLTEEGRALNDKGQHILDEMSCKVRLTSEEQQELTRICQQIENRLRQ